MQTINRILCTSGVTANWTDAYGQRVETPRIALGMRCRLRLSLMSDETENGNLLALPYEEMVCASYYIALDVDWDRETRPKLIQITGVTLEKSASGGAVFIGELPNTALPDLLDAVGKGERVSFKAEIGGFASGGTAASFVVQFPLDVQNRIWLGDEPETAAPDPEWLNAAQVRALIAEAVGSAAGSPGKAATIRVGTVTDVEYDAGGGVENSGTETDAVLDFRLRCGRDGEKGEPGRDGRDGASFSYDASGVPSERGAYDSEKAGFVFACTANDDQKRTCTWYFYKKKSDAFGDWYPPLVKIEYPGLDGENAKLIPPMEFEYPENLAENLLKYFYFTLADYPAAWIAAVVIDTENGELQLPYFHDQGIRKIEKKDEKFFVYFGANVPSFATGRVYFAQGLSGITGGGSGGDTPSVSAKIYYGFVPYEVAGDNTESVASLTPAMLTDEGSSITQANAAAMGKTSLGNVPAGAWAVVMIPKAADLEALKFDGIGGYTEFSLDNGFENSGANGAEILLGDVPYLVYGQFNLAESELFFTVQERN